MSSPICVGGLFGFVLLLLDWLVTGFGFGAGGFGAGAAAGFGAGTDAAGFGFGFSASFAGAAAAGAAATGAGFCSIFFNSSFFTEAAGAAAAAGAAVLVAAMVFSSGFEGPQPMSDANFENIDWFSDEMLPPSLKQKRFDDRELINNYIQWNCFLSITTLRLATTDAMRNETKKEQHVTLFLIATRGFGCKLCNARARNTIFFKCRFCFFLKYVVLNCKRGFSFWIQSIQHSGFTKFKFVFGMYYKRF